MAKRYLTPVIFSEQTAPSTPPSGTVVIYAKADGKMYRKDDAGVETELGGGGGTDQAFVWDPVTDQYVEGGRIFIGPNDPDGEGYTQAAGDAWIDALSTGATLEERTSPPDIPGSGYGKLYVTNEGDVAGINDSGADLFSDYRRIRGKELTQWRAALANREFAPANAYIVGTSMTEGYGQTTFAKTWFDIFRDALQREYRNGGEGFNGITFNQIGGGTTTFPHPWTFSGPEIDFADGGWGLGRRSVNMNETSPTPSFMTRSFYGDRVYVVYTTVSIGGTMKITIDGGTPATQSTNDPITQSGRIWDSGPLTLGTHTLRIEPNADENLIVIDGVMIFATDTLVGVHTLNGAHSGYNSGAFAGLLSNGSDEFWADIMFQPYTRVSSGTNGITGNGTTTVTFTGANFTSDDIGEVIYSGTDTTFPRGVRIVSVTNSTTVVVNKTVPNATFTGYFTRSRVTDAVRNSTTLITSASAAFNQWDRGKTVSGTGIPAGTVIRRVVSATNIELSQAATSSGSGGTLQIKNRQKYPLRPHLLMLEHSINDMQLNVTKSLYKTYMVAIETVAIEQGQLDQPTMTGIYNDESPSVMLIGMWAPSNVGNAGVIINVTNGSNIISDATDVSNRFTVADVGKTITSVGNTPIPASTTITGPNGSWIESTTAPGTYTQVTISNNALATQAGEDATIVSRQNTNARYYDFHAALYELSVEQGWALYDLYNIGGWIGTDELGLTADLIHPNDQGAQWIADEMSMSVGGVKKLASIPQGIFDRAGEMIVAESTDRATKKPGILKKVTADTASGTTAGVMVDITEFAFNIAPGETLAFQFYLAWTVTAVTSGLLFDFNPAAGVSAPADLIMTCWGPHSTSSGVNAGQWYGRQDAVWGTDLTIPASNTNATTIPTMILLTGSVTAGAIGGLITPRFGPEANAATTLQRGSWALIL